MPGRRVSEVQAAPVSVDAFLPASPPVPAEADEAFDRFARLVRAHLNVPVSLVSLVWQQGQVFPGAEGLPEPYQTERSTPLSHSFCRHVVARQAPLIVPNAILDPLVRDNLSIPELGAAAYAGFPITQADGTVVGSLCAIDTEPRDWSAVDLEFMRDLAAACSSEFQLRSAQRLAMQAVARAEVAAAVSEQADRQSRVLLMLSETLSTAGTVEEVAETLHAVATSQLSAQWSGVALLNGRRLKSGWMEAFPESAQERLTDFGLDEDFPPSRAVREMRPLFYEDDQQIRADFPGLAGDVVFGGGTHARALLPLEIEGQALGVLILAWDHPVEMDESSRAVMVALSRYTAQAVHRAQLLAERRLVAEVLQRAMLTELPQPDHLLLSARYKPAATADAVGGDWYDALLLPDGATAVVIGDVVGHDVEAAATMGTLRNLTRAFAYDGLVAPHAVVSHLDDALARLDVHAVATMLMARIDSPDGGVTHTITWTSAGHPPLLLMLPDGGLEKIIAPPDLLVGIDPRARRADHTYPVPPGATLVLYTDGLIERRGHSLAEGVERLGEVLLSGAGLPLGRLLDHVLDELVDHHPHDDCAILAVRFPTREDLAADRKPL